MIQVLKAKGPINSEVIDSSMIESILWRLKSKSTHPAFTQTYWKQGSNLVKSLKLRNYLLEVHED